MFFVRVWIRTRTAGSERSGRQTRSERGPPKSPRATAIGLILDGNIQSAIIHQDKKTPRMGCFLFVCGYGREPQVRNAAVVRPRSERGPPKSPRATAIGLILDGNIQSAIIHQDKKTPHFGVFFIRVWIRNRYQKLEDLAGISSTVMQTVGDECSGRSPVKQYVAMHSVGSFGSGSKPFWHVPGISAAV